MHVLGIDAGGTKTHCLLADEHCEVVAEARGGGANLQGEGELQVEKVLHTVMAEALGDRGIVPTAICLGIAGVDRDEDVQIVQGLMRRIGFNARILVVNDALVALVAGAGDAPGVVVVAGTGSISYGRNGHGQGARAGGWGHVLGDEGSGYWMGRLALRAVVREADGRGPVTKLTPYVFQHFNVARAQDLIQQVYYRNIRPSAIAALARTLQRAHEEGDEAAQSILERAATELTASAASVVEQLAMTNDSFPVILAGGIFQAVPWLYAELGRRLPEDVAPNCEVKLLDKPPAYGAVLLAISHAKGNANIPMYKAPPEGGSHAA
jgi:N-acetylglucosamine kinase-like BadF-type ATPase